MLITHDKIYINGNWLPPAQATYATVVNSASEDVLASACMCFGLEVDQAVNAANAAFASWSILCSEDRKVYLAKAQKELAEKLEEIALLIAQLRIGQVHIKGSHLNPLAPFGGFKQSGNGRELGKYGLQESLEFKAIFN